MNDGEPLAIICNEHGPQVSAVVCGHMLKQTSRALGFVENNSAPDDLQAWCEECETMFLQEGEMTREFLDFNAMALVCVVCYLTLKERHTKPAPLT